MSSDVRNIRSHYYKKVGFHGVEEKKTLELLFKETALDYDKLKHFCSRFPLTADRRPLVWKVVLEILPRFTTSHEFVTRQRKEQYNDLLRAVDVMKRLPKNTHLSQKFVFMWGLELKRWNFDFNRWLLSSPPLRMEKISKALLGMFPGSEVDCYWLAKAMVTARVNKVEKQLQTFVDLFWNALEREDLDLHVHLVALVKEGSSTPTRVQVLPLEEWFSTLFAQVLHSEALLRVWDRIVGSHERVLPFIAVALVIRLRMTLLQESTSDGLAQALVKTVRDTVLVSEEASSQCVCQGFELCGDYGA